jgi:xanthine dehydrogenase accessory factor
MIKTPVADMGWPRQLGETLQRQDCVLITIISVKGSAPRETASHMLVSTSGQLGSIGGGNLEFSATEFALKMLKEPGQATVQQQMYGLGPRLNQCCGGAVTVLFERFDKFTSADQSGMEWLYSLLDHTGLSPE